MSARRSRRALFPVLVAVGVLTAGCAGVPTSSSPQVIGPAVGGVASADSSLLPEPNSDPRTLVQDFLNASAANDPSHTAARLYLSPDARSRWSDSTATVLDNLQFSTFDGTASTVSVTGNRIGYVDAHGIYTPSLVGDGSGAGGEPATFVFTIKDSGPGHQWRISQLSDGLLLSAKGFENEFGQRPIYFLDSTEHRLVPDPRFTDIQDVPASTDDLINWLLTELVAGPSPSLASAVVNELPAQVEPSVALSNVVSVTIPGLAQLDGQTRYLLAAQVAATLSTVTGTEPIRLLDGGRPVEIPKINNTQFSSSDFISAGLFPGSTAPPVFYIRSGGVVGSDGNRLPGALGSGAYGLSSVAVAAGPGNDLQVAGIVGADDQKRLVLGSLSAGLRPVAGVTGSLTRPSWAAAFHEIWVGDGPNLYRVSENAAGTATVTKVSLIPEATQPQSIIAVRVSPEGSRIAMVLAGQNGTAQLWVGAIARVGSQVSIESLSAVSPAGVALRDVAWNDGLKLFVIGRTVVNRDPVFAEIQVDGSLWTPKPLTNLPEAPDSITVAENLNAWVSSDTSVWTQSGDVWVSAGTGTGDTPGTAPVYAE